MSEPLIDDLLIYTEEVDSPEVTLNEDELLLSDEDVPLESPATPAAAPSPKNPKPEVEPEDSDEPEVPACLEDDEEEEEEPERGGGGFKRQKVPEVAEAALPAPKCPLPVKREPPRRGYTGHSFPNRGRGHLYTWTPPMFPPDGAFDPFAPFPGNLPPMRGNAPFYQQNAFQPRPHAHQRAPRFFYQAEPPGAVGGRGQEFFQIEPPRKVLINPNFKGGVEAAKNQLIKEQFLLPSWSDVELERQQQEFISKNLRCMEKRRHERSPKRYSRSPSPHRPRQPARYVAPPKVQKSVKTEAEEEDEETRAYRQQIAKQKQKREDLLKQKEMRRRQAAELLPVARLEPIIVTEKKIILKKKDGGGGAEAELQPDGDLTPPPRRIVLKPTPHSHKRKIINL